MSNRPARIRAIVVAVLVLAFVIPWTYAHIAYAWPWKRFQTGTLISGTFTLSRAHSGIVWFTPNRGTATFCFDPDPTFTFRDFP